MLNIIPARKRSQSWHCNELRKRIVALVCISLLLPSMALIGHKVDEDGLIRSSNAAVIVRIITQVFINILLFALRLAIGHAVLGNFV